ncbi:MAG: hypothetical protein NVS3B20_15820 [Polyangiales bacterium]
MLSGAGCRRKGHTWEREVARVFGAVFGVDKVRRGFQYRDGAECPDVIAPNFWIEAKRGRRTNARAALRQAIAASQGKGFWPLAVTKDDGEPATITMGLEDFVDLLGEWHAGRNQ